MTRFMEALSFESVKHVSSDRPMLLGPTRRSLAIASDFSFRVLPFHCFIFFIFLHGDGVVHDAVPKGGLCEFCPGLLRRLQPRASFSSVVDWRRAWRLCIEGREYQFVLVSSGSVHRWRGSPLCFDGKKIVYACNNGCIRDASALPGYTCCAPSMPSISYLYIPLIRHPPKLPFPSVRSVAAAALYCHLRLVPLSDLCPLLALRRRRRHLSQHVS